MEGGGENLNASDDRNSRQTQEHFWLSVDNEESNSAVACKRRNSKIESYNCMSRSEPVRVISGVRRQPPLNGMVESIGGGPEINWLIKNSAEIAEPKNEILSRTFVAFSVKNLFKICFYFAIMWLMLNAQFGRVESAPVKTSLSKLHKGLANNRTLKSIAEGFWLAKKSARQKRPVNKNCKEYDITSRAFLADLIFEGTARSRSRRASGRYVTFVVQKILKQKSNWLRPKTQIRLHFGGKLSRRYLRINPLNDCPLNSITSSGKAMANLQVGEKYYVFADHFGLMNYTARGEPIVVNRRNLKSIRSVLSKNKEKPPRVVGLQDLNVKIAQPLRLNCRVRGRPVPRINWYKDGTPLIPSSHVNVTYYRKIRVRRTSKRREVQAEYKCRWLLSDPYHSFYSSSREPDRSQLFLTNTTERRNSSIEIKALELKDGGTYECRATSITGKTAKASAHINVWKVYSPNPTDPEKSLHIKKCSIDAYCLNGGQCYFIEHLGEHMCECETGFKGARCEIKEVSSIGIKSYICGFNVGYSSYYC